MEIKCHCPNQRCKSTLSLCGRSITVVSFDEKKTVSFHLNKDTARELIKSLTEYLEESDAG